MKEEKPIEIYVLIGFVVLLMIGGGMIYGPGIVKEWAVDKAIAEKMPPNLKEKAERGDNEAMFELGLFYIHASIGVADTEMDKYFKKGMECLKSVKPPLDGEAMYMLGQYSSWFPMKSESDGQEYFAKAIEIFSACKDANAYYALHEVYTWGYGTQVDNDKADHYYDLYKAECEKNNKEPERKLDKLPVCEG